MVVRNNEVHAEPLCGFGLSKGSHPGVDRDHQANALGTGRFKYARLHSVPLADAMRHVKADKAAEHFDCSLQQDHSSRAIHVVIAVEQHRLAIGNGLLQALDGCGHAEHQQRVVQMRGFGIQKCEGFVRIE